VLQLTSYPARYASVSSRRISSISGAATYNLPSQIFLGQQLLHLVHLGCCNLHPTQPDTPRSAVVASRPSRVLQLTSYPARHASVSSCCISSISGAVTYSLPSQTHLGQQLSHLVHLRCCNLQSIQPDTLRSAVVASRSSQVLQLTPYPARYASVSSCRISSISGAATYKLPSQTCLGQQLSHFVHLRCCNLQTTQLDTPRSAVVASRSSQVLQLTSYPAGHASVSSRRILLTLDVATCSLSNKTRLGQQSSHLVHLRCCNLQPTQPDTPWSAVVASRPSRVLQLTPCQAQEASISVNY
jgi:hypothetical protein